MLMQFYETSIVARFAQATLGIQVLSSPSRPYGNDFVVQYDALLEDFPLRVAAEPDTRLVAALSYLAFPVGRPPVPWWERGPIEPPPVFSQEIASFTDTLLSTPLIPSETSPFAKRSLLRLAGTAGTVTWLVVTATGLPMVLIVGAAVGVIVVRPAIAISEALWDGARPEVVQFGRDATATALDALRNRLGINRESDNEPKQH